MNDKHRVEALTLEILEAIGERSDITQRGMARRSGVALGLANAYLKRCVRKGLVKVRQAPANRYLYYLTPQGFAEKSRLTARYLSYSFTFYRRVGESYAALFDAIEANRLGELGFYGASELAEIAAIRALDRGAEIRAICDPARRTKHFLNVPVVAHPSQAPEVATWVLTTLENPHEQWRALSDAVGKDRALAPSVLGLSFATQ